MEIVIGVTGLLIAIASAVFAWPAFEDYLEKRREKQQPSAGRLLNAVKTRGELRIGLFEYPPLASYRAEGVILLPEGYYIELLNQLCSIHRIKPVLVPTALSDSITSLKAGTIDVFACIFKTPKRCESLDFAALLHFISVTGVCRDGYSKVNVHNDLQRNDVRIVVCKGEIGHELLIDDFGIPKHDKRVTVIDATDIADAIALVETNRADIGIADSLSITRFLSESHESKFRHLFVDEPLYVASCGYAIRKGEHEFREWLDSELRALAKTVENQQHEKIALQGYDRVVRTVFKAQQSHALEPAKGPVSNGESSPPAQ
ncbi:substrate-binding periplasmic protein [Botrimarina hoheduenensis]|uniref:Cystine transporter subunit n=1 Tax=Botrimarina hoheduenensis TaxID=2528000 RepID=A0A5C5WBY8_9BACT|nr:transporter substrate-binding domain-containing protein [Botrimarina hoheduenensis]TWT47683.1 cystine transporter subunit [Botrimarina hoheduenensis]